MGTQRGGKSPQPREIKLRDVRGGLVPADQQFHLTAETPTPQAPFDVRPIRTADRFGLVVIDQASRNALFWFQLVPAQYARLIEQINEIADPDALEHTNLAMNVVGAAMSYVLATGQDLALPPDAYGEHGAMRGLSRDEAEVRLAAAVQALVTAHHVTVTRQSEVSGG